MEPCPDFEKFERHDLFFLSAEGKREIFAGANPQVMVFPQAKALIGMLDKIPGIVCCQNGVDPDLLKLGFSWCEKKDGVRIRFAALVHPAHVKRKITPWEVFAEADDPDRFAQESSAVWKAFFGVRRWMNGTGVKAGVFGSCALEMVTGLPYLTETSDLDLIAVMDEKIMTSSWYRACVGLTGRTHLDLELYFPGLGSVKAAEWFSGSESLLLKGTQKICIVERSALLEGIRKR